MENLFDEEYESLGREDQEELMLSHSLIFERCPTTIFLPAESLVYVSDQPADFYHFFSPQESEPYPWQESFHLLCPSPSNEAMMEATPVLTEDVEVKIENALVLKKRRPARDNKKPKKKQKNGESCCSCDDDEKTRARASRGTATDPQSLYARKRREKINERLRILQKLVPNGTKVDITTMLEEAVEYVKFLKLQIQLLSSDDMWMYAPIAYNMGLYKNIPPSF